MIVPQSYKFKCANCGYIKVVKPKSDVLNPIDFISTCPKCKSKMKKEKIDIIDEVLNIFK